MEQGAGVNKYTLAGLLIGTAFLMAACLCAPVSLLPLVWTPTPLVPSPTFTLKPSPTFTVSLPTETPTPTTVRTPLYGEADPACISNLEQELHTSETTFSSGKALE